jgi:hypothetical protein
MRSILLFMIALVLLLPSAASAHVVNDQTIYEDIQYSAVKEQIVILSGLGVIASEHGASLFRPNEKLTRMELALWAGTFLKLTDADAAAQDITKAAWDKGIITSLQGNATYQDANQAYFQGQAKAAQPDAEMTREAFISFMASYLDQKINGKTLYERAGCSPGASGLIEAVTQQEVKDAKGSVSKVYILQINGKKLVLGAHPKIIHASVDPAQWKGKNIVSSWLMKAEGADEQVQLITFEQQPADTGQKEAVNKTADHTHDGHGSESSAASKAGTLTTAGFPFFPSAVAALIVLIAVWLFAKRKRKAV